MLYIFLVDNGTMLQLEMNLALETVEYLKGVILSMTRIPKEKQILLISGGESLEDGEKVCKYTAGTDTNPIFLFSMSSIEEGVPPSPNQLEVQDRLKAKVESALGLPDTQNTVAVRAALAQEYVESSKEQSRMCETLIHDQHLQHQGWSAVVANLEDTASALSKRTEKFQDAFKIYLSNRERYKSVIDAFDDDVALLHQIPVFPSLLRASSDKSMVGSIIPGEPYDQDRTVTLLEWISERGSNQSLEQVADSCYRTLTQMDCQLMNHLKSNASAAIEGSKNPTMKEIGGLGDRLSQLEQLSLEARRVVQEQSDLSNAFLQNQQRASNLKDPSILPDLCNSHRQQLLVMTENHQTVISIRKRCANAKSELSANLHSRLKWIVFIQNKIAEAAQNIILNFESLRRLGKKLEVIEQLHMAPSMFMTTSVEVVRRKAFSQRYLRQTSELSSKFEKLYNEEINLRREFQSKLNKHFIYRMFPGLEDTPPLFATKRPNAFDLELPDITLQDIEELRRKLPELANDLELPDERALDNLFNRSYNEGFTAEDGATRTSLQTMAKRLPSRNSHELMVMSAMNPLSFKKKLHQQHGSPAKYQDSDTDDNDDREKYRLKQGNNSNKKLTRSLPSEQTTDLPFEKTIVSDSSGIDPSSSSEGGGTASSKTGQSSFSSIQHQHSLSLAKFKSDLSECREDVKRCKETCVVAGESVKAQLLRSIHSITQSLEEEIINLKQELDEKSRSEAMDLENVRNEKNEELRESIRKMTLEHELEMDNLKVDMQKCEKSEELQNQVLRLTNDLSEKEAKLQELNETCAALEKAKSSLDYEKDKIVSILEAGFIQREKLSIQKKEEELQAKYNNEYEELKEKLRVTESREEALKSDKESSIAQKCLELKENMEDEFKRRLDEEKEALNILMEKEIRLENEKANARAKKEIDVLRSRFKIMQASGALDRSPSASETELSVESPRPELIEQIRSAMSSENENNLRAERNKWEIRFSQMSSEYKKQIEDIKADSLANLKEVLANALEEKNDILSKHSQEKEELIGSQKKSEDEKLSLKVKLEELLSQIPKLEFEVCSNEGEDSSSEETKLRSKQNSQRHVINNPKLCIGCPGIGDHVMIVWNCVKEQYIIYNESDVYIFLHSDSVSVLGLSTEKRYCAGIIVNVEHCLTRKTGNRFNLPKGTRFIRVKCKPTGRFNAISRGKPSNAQSDDGNTECKI